MTEETQAQVQAEAPVTPAKTDVPFDVNSLMEEIKKEDEANQAAIKKQLDEAKNSSVSQTQVKELVKDMLKKTEADMSEQKTLFEKNLTDRESQIEVLKAKLDSLTSGSKATSDANTTAPVTPNSNNDVDVFTKMVSEPQANDSNFSVIMNNNSPQRDVAYDMEIYNQLQKGRKFR